MRLQFKIPGWLSDLNAILTRKLPKFLSRLNEISGGRGNICLVSGPLTPENFEVFENVIFDCQVLWMVHEGEWNSVGFFVL